MKKTVSFILTLLICSILLTSCATSGSSSDPIADPSVVIAYNQNSEAADKLKTLIEQKTGEQISVVQAKDVRSSFAIFVDAEGADPDIEIYGWKRVPDSNALYLDFSLNSVDFEPMATALLEKISTVESIKNIETAYFENSIYEANEGLYSYIDEKAEALKYNILNAYTVYDSTNIEGTIYYVSEGGSDSNDGRSPDTAWATPARVCEAELSPGDAVLFERGGLYRGKINCSAGVTYGTYGEGQMPIITVSKRNYAESSLWELHDAEHNIWKLRPYVEDPAIIVVNAHLYDVECYDELLPTRIWDNVVDSTECTYQKLLEREDDLVYYWGTEESNFVNFNENNKNYVLYLKSEKPPYEYENIEIGEDRSAFTISGNMPVPNVTVDGFCIKYSGGGVSALLRLVENLTVKNCVCAWIGGGLWGGATYTNKATRLGNAIGVFGGCDGFYVYNNWTYQIYDTGISPQYHYSSGTSCMDNISICDNLIERSYWGIELWLAPKEGAVPNPSVSNVNISGNILRYGFDSWGTMSHSHPEWGSMYNSGYSTNNISNFKVEYNILDRSFVEGHPEVKTRMFCIDLSGANGKIEYSNNIFVQYTDQLIGKFTLDGEKTTSLTATPANLKRLLHLVEEHSDATLSENLFFYQKR